VEPEPAAESVDDTNASEVIKPLITCSSHWHLPGPLPLQCSRRGALAGTAATGLAGWQPSSLGSFGGITQWVHNSRAESACAMRPVSAVYIVRVDTKYPPPVARHT
jgi:hypothetical protein